MLDPKSTATTSHQPSAPTSSSSTLVQLPASDEEKDDIFQDLDLSVVDDAGHWDLTFLKPDDVNMVDNFPSFEEFNRELMTIPEDEGDLGH